MFVQVKDSRTGGKVVINNWVWSKQGAQAELFHRINVLSIIKPVQMALWAAKISSSERKKLWERLSLGRKCHPVLRPWPKSCSNPSRAVIVGSIPSRACRLLWQWGSVTKGTGRCFYKQTEERGVTAQGFILHLSALENLQTRTWVCKVLYRQRCLQILTAWQGNADSKSCSGL